MQLVVRNTWRWLSLRRRWCVWVALVVAVATVGCAQVCRSVVDGREVPCPLSREDLRKVTAWIAGEVARDRQPFCWRHSHISLLGHCRKGFNLVWPVCWQGCAAGRTNCGAGCASSGAACREETWDMVKESLVLGVNVASLGRASTATQAAKLARVKGLARAGSKAERNQRRIELQLSTADWVKESVGDFGSLTTPEVDRELKQHFSGDDLRWVQEQYALHHLALVLESEGDKGARDTLADIAQVDPTGVAAVVDAFSQPMCRAPLPFPAIKLRGHDGGAPPQQVARSQPHRPELDASIRQLDLTRREADLAWRAVRPERGDLVTVKIADEQDRLFTSSAYAAELGTLRDLGDARWIGQDRDLAHIPSARWLNERVPESKMVLRTSSIGAQLSAAEAGLGVVLLPDSYGKRGPLSAVRLSAALRASLPPTPRESLWLVGHRATRDVPRIAAVWETILDTISRFR